MTFDFPPTLSDFLRCDDPARLVVGPFGSGKSSVCVAEFVRRALEQAPGRDGIRRTRFAAIRNTYPELRDTTRRTFDQWVFRITDGRPDRLGKWKEQEFLFRMKFNDVESEILFRSLDRPEDVHKLLSLELTGSYINEWREIPREIFEGLTGRIGRYPAMDEGGPSWRGIWGDSNPWHPTHWISLLNKRYPNTIRVFRQPGGRSANAENVRNLEPGYYERLCKGKDEEWIQVYVDGLDATAEVGSVFGKLLAALRGRNGISDFDHAAGDCFSAWDFGIADSMAIWVFRFNERRGVDVVDWYENSGFGLPHYFAWLKSRPWKFIAHYLPHDGRSRSWLTGKNAVQLFNEEFGPGMAPIAPELGVDQGIGAARWLLEQDTTRFHARVDEVSKDRDLSGLGTLAEYKFSWDETNKCFSKNPLHNFASHTADAFRVLACVVRHSDLITRVKAPEPPLVVVPKPPTFDELKKETIRRNRDQRRHV